MAAKQTITVTAVVVALIITGMVLGSLTARYYSGDNTQGPPVQRMLWPDPKTLQEFSITDHTGAEFGLDRLRGQWSFLFFGYTNCPDVCPVTMSVLDQVDSALDYRGIRDTQTVFISVDPERDTRERVASYVQGFNPDFIGLRGSEEEIRSLSAQLGVVSRSHADSGHGHEDHEPGYLVDHSTAVFLVDPEGRLVSLFTPPHSIEQVVGRYLKIRQFIDNRS